MATSAATKQPVGVIGLGYLGTALAHRLLDAGYSTLVYNRTKEKAGPLLERGAQWSDNPLSECERILVSLYTTEVVEEVFATLDPGLHTGLIIIDTTTGDPQQTTALGESLAQRGVYYLESPIAASSEQTRRGEALALVAGPQRAFKACEDLFAALAAKTFHVGPWGNAAKMKLANNLVLGLNRLALAEGLLFAEAIGLDPATTLNVLKEGNAYSVVMDVKGQKMIERDFTTQARLTQHAKDVRLILDEATRVGLSLPVSQLHLELLDRAEAAGLGDQDNSAIIEALRSSSP